MTGYDPHILMQNAKIRNDQAITITSSEIENLKISKKLAQPTKNVTTPPIAKLSPSPSTAGLS